MDEHAQFDGLAAVLLAIAAEPDKVGDLYETFRDFFHLIRNRMNNLKLGMYLAARDDDPGRWAAIQSSYADMERLLDDIQKFFKGARLSPIRASLGLLIEEHRPRWVGLVEAAGGKLAILPPIEPAIGRFDPVRLGQALDAVAAWRCRRIGPGTVVRVAWEACGDDLVLDWSESIPGGLTEESREEVLGPLAVPNLARIVMAHGGSFELAEGPTFGFRLRWPCDAIVAEEPLVCEVGRA